MQDQVGRRFLLVGRVAVFPQDALDRRSQFGADRFLDRPVNRDVGANALGDFAGDDEEVVVPEYLPRGLVMTSGSCAVEVRSSRTPAP